MQTRSRTTKRTDERHAPVPEFQIDVVAAHSVRDWLWRRFIYLSTTHAFACRHFANSKGQSYHGNADKENPESEAGEQSFVCNSLRGHFGAGRNIVAGEHKNSHSRNT
jgi:hypothetical protein